MQSRKFTLSVVVSLIVALLVTACGGAAAPPRTPDSIVAALKTAGLEAESPQPMTKADYGMAPFVGQGVIFVIPSLCADCGGRAIVGSKDEIGQLRAYYTSLGEQSAMLFSWVFATPDGKALLQINGDLPEDQARKYEQALQ